MEENPSLAKYLYSKPYTATKAIRRGLVLGAIVGLLLALVINIGLPVTRMQLWIVIAGGAVVMAAMNRAFMVLRKKLPNNGQVVAATVFTGSIATVYTTWYHQTAWFAFFFVAMLVRSFIADFGHEKARWESEIMAEKAKYRTPITHD